MSRVRIIGGGLSGVLAALEAHRLGARDIELHERFSQLGGAALPSERHGVELRERFVSFGPKDDPVRRRLEAVGVGFDDVEGCTGSVSPTDMGPPVFTPDFDGPALPCGDIEVGEVRGPALAHRIMAYPKELHEPLARYLKWRLGAEAGEAHACAAGIMGVDHVLPLGSDATAMAAARRRDPRVDSFFGMPLTSCSDTERPMIGAPSGGFGAFFRRCHRALRQIGVRIQEDSFVAPRQVLAEHRQGDILVWSADPAPLFKLIDRPAPRLLEASHAAYVFAARWTGPRPFVVRNYTAAGVCIQAHVYESAGRTLLAAECAGEADSTDLRYEVHRLLSGFEGDLALGELLSATVKPRWTYQTVEAVAGLAELRTQLAQRHGSGFITNGWERSAPGDRFAYVSGLIAGIFAPNVRNSAAA